MSTRLALRIQERLDKLPPSERKLAALVLDRQDDILTYSATELAALAGVSKATAARLFQSLGYRDFNEVRLQAREERNRTEPFARSAVPAAAATGGRSIGAHLRLEVANLTRTFEELRPDVLDRAAALLADAPRLWLLGTGAEEGLVRHARLLFARVRPDVQLLGAGAVLAEDLAMTGPRDALLLVTLPPRAKALKPILAYARTTRMSVVAVADPSSAAWAGRMSSLVLPVHAASHGLGPSHSAAASLLRLLALALAERIGRTAASRADLVAEIHEELEDQEQPMPRAFT